MTAGSKSATEKIKSAYISLLRTKSFADVTVTEVAEAAGVSRISFYRAYNSLDELLEECTRDTSYIFTDILKCTSAEEKRKAWKEHVYLFFKNVENDSFPISLVVPENAPLILTKVNAMLCDLLDEYCSNNKEKILLFANFGILASMGRMWINKNFEPPREEVCELALNMILKNISECADIVESDKVEKS